MTRPEPGAGWRHEIVDDVGSDLAAVERVGAVEAQRWCNFVVLVPAELPAGHALETPTLRREVRPGRAEHMTGGRSPWSEANPSSLRFEIGDGNRRLRVKEFLYDWAPPAGDQPCLWESKTQAVGLDDRYVVWLGTDYMGRRGAYARIARTSVELSVIDGEYGDDELAGLYRSLRAVDRDALAAIARTSFADLSYWARHDAPLLNVPTGLLVLRRTKAAEDTRWQRDPGGLDAPVDVPDELAGYRLDAAARSRGPAGEVEHGFLYVAGEDSGQELRLLVQRAGQGRIEVPSEVEDHPCETTSRAIAGRAVQLAYVDARHGPFDAVWREPDGEVEAKVQLSAGAAWSLERVDGVLADVMAAIAAGVRA